MTADGSPAAAASDGPLGILAGGGVLPEQIADSTLARGRGVHIVGIEGEAGRGIERFAHSWANWGAIGRMTASFKAAGCRDLILVGAVTRPDWRKVRPDLGLIKAVPTIIRLFGGGDDHVLRRVVRFFEAQGFTVRGVAEVAPELVVAAGALGRIAPAPSYSADAARGFALIEALGFADVGQAVVMRDGRAVAIEAAEGTDRMLTRLAASGDRRAAGGVLVKKPKPGQELRIDMPAIGPRTVEFGATAGLAGIAVEAGRVLAAERAQLIATADATGLFVAGVERSAAATVAARPALALAPLNRLPADKYLRRDMARGANLIAAVAPYANSAGVVVVRRHVIAIETGEGVAAMFDRVKTLRQWGATAHSRRRGALALAASAIAASGLESIMASAADAGLAGIALPSAMAPEEVDVAGRIAEERGLAIAAVLGPWQGRTP